jgi:hypothetical protein
MDVTKYLKQHLKSGRHHLSRKLSIGPTMQPKDQPLIFLHVPKTAGTTMRSIIERQYPAANLYYVYDGAGCFHTTSDLKTLTEDEKKKILVYAGHVSYGVHNVIARPSSYYAMLRDPVDRVISYYHHIMNHNPSFKANRMSLMKFFERKDKQLDNHQTRIVSGVRAPFKGCSEDLLWAAIDNINSDFCAIGITEMFDQSLLLLSQVLGWKSFEYERKNVSADRPLREYFSKGEINMIRNSNRLDEMLYSYAKRQIEQQLRETGAKFGDAKELRTASGALSPHADINVKEAGQH